MGYRSAASPREGRALNTNVSGPAILRFTNLTSAWATATSCKSHPRKGIFSSQTTGSEGGLCQSQNRQAHRETEWTGAHHYGGKWQEQWTQHGWTGPSPLGSARKQWVCEPAFLHQLCQHCTVSQCSPGEHGFKRYNFRTHLYQPSEMSTQEINSESRLLKERFGCCVTVRITAGYGEVLLIRFSCFLNYSKLF